MAVISPSERFNQLLSGYRNETAGIRTGTSGTGVSQGSSSVDGPSFTDTMKKVVESVNEQQVNSDEMSARFIAGEVENVHDAMLAMEKASTSFRFLVEVRNKLMEGYQEVMRMQI